MPRLFDLFRRAPGMFLRTVDYDGAAAFVSGFDAALEGRMLDGLREWLIPVLDCGSNLAWTELVRMLHEQTYGVTMEEVEAGSRVEFLLLVLEEFFEALDRPVGRREIFARYESWLRRQDWFGPHSPDWFSLEFAGPEPRRRRAR